MDRNITDFDCTARELAAVLARLPAHLPVSDAFEREWLPGAHWWSSQREHVTGWLREMDGPGAYQRKARALGARHFWTHLQCAPGLLWVAEALEVDQALVEGASVAAGEKAAAKARPSAQCAAVRRIVPWELIAEKVVPSVQVRRHGLRPLRTRDGG